jgi:hypothetical protein
MAYTHRICPESACVDPGSAGLRARLGWGYESNVSN